MYGKYIYGIIRRSNQTTWDIPRGGGSSPVYTIAYQDLSCVVSNYSGEEFNSMPKEEIIRCLLAHQAVVERIMREHAVLPVKFGTVLATSDEVRDLLSQGRQRFVDALAWIQGKVEMEVAATWDLKRVLAGIAQQEEIVQLRRYIAQRPAAEARAWQIQAGKRVKEILDARRDAYRDQVLESLKDITLDVQPNALVADEMVINVAFLVPKEHRESFDQRVQELDETFGGEIDFRIIGPLPPYSFSTVEVTRPDAQRIEEARRLLGLGEWASEAELKQASRRLAAQSHPDAHPQDELAERRFAEVQQASERLISYCRGQAQGRRGQRYSLATEDVNQALLITIRRPAAMVC